MRSTIGYQPHIALLLNLDTEWTQRRGKKIEEPFRGVCTRINRLCHDYSSRLSENYRRTTVDDDTRSADENAAIENSLYSPLFFVPWGPSDCQAIVLLDDFDAVHHLTTGLDTSIEEVSIGFCPKADCFSDDRTSSHLRNIADLFSTEHNSNVQSDDARRSTLKHQPLLAFTRYKFDAFASLGFNLLFQEALFAAMPKQIRSLQVSLNAAYDSSQSLRSVLGNDAASINQFTMSFLDLQGTEEIGSVITCNNYSVAMTIIAAIRSLTYADIFNASSKGEELRTALLSSHVWNQLKRIQPRVDGIGGEPSLGDNHVFRWTRTTLSVEQHAYYGKEERRASCRGFVGAVSEFQVPAGHHQKLKQHVDDSSKEQPEFLRFCDDVTMYKAGRGDYMVSLSSSDSQSSILLSDAIRLEIEQSKRLGTSVPQDYGRDVVDRTTYISIPVVNCLDTNDVSPGRSLGKHHFAPFGSALREMQLRLCYPNSVPGSAQPTSAPDRGRLCIDRLKRIPPTYGLPLALRRTIECLYQEFAVLIGDYYSFDGIIDLYDAFAALHITLTQSLKELRLAELQIANCKTIPPLDDERVEHIARFVDALHSAMAHRRAYSYSEPVSRDMGIELRGGLNQILAASDAVLKCGLGLLRRYTNDRPSESDRRANVGGLARLSFRPGMRAYSLAIGTESHAELCFVETDVPRVMHVGSYCDYIHEAAHLIFASMKRLDESKGFDIKALSNTESEARRYSFFEERLNEIFALLFVRTLFFPKRAEAGNRNDGQFNEFVIHQMIANEKSRNGRDSDSTETINQVSEFLIRLCISDLLVPNAEPGCRWPMNVELRHLNDPVARQNAIERVIVAASAALPEREQYWMGPFSSGWAHCVREFDRIYSQLRVPLTQLHKWASTVFSRYFADVQPERVGETQDELEFSRLTRQALIDGVPLSRLALGVTKVGASIDGGIDMLALICEVLSAYVGRQDISNDARLFVTIDPESGEIELDIKDGNWHPYLIDRGATAMYCCIPEARGRRMKQQIASIKTCWDLASQLRGRRFCEIVDDNWGLE